MQIAALPYVKMPTAKRALGNRKWEGGLLVPIGISIAKSALSIGLTPELDWVADADGHGHHAAMVQVASLGWQATRGSTFRRNRGASGIGIQPGRASRPARTDRRLIW